MANSQNTNYHSFPGRVRLSSRFLKRKPKLMKEMKKILKTILAVGCFAAIILAGAENADGSCDLVWTLAWMAVAVLCGRGYGKLEKSNI